MICAGCLAELRAEKTKTKREIHFSLMPLVHVIVGVIVIWTVYYQIGEILVTIPADLHDGKIWESDSSF
ncbi:MAG: hypothetical protein ACI9R3_003494 [Verrucomicrobiales bacterium]|jgi:hypothetical protein